ncbi:MULTISPECIES: hypothetical protein [Dyella]|uniref:Uncharacterized protein n=2 Tax=Dyella TaxID=231454 RepID=A0A4R0YJ05_9GAMM|nr:MULTISPECIES: hypothetical protein [Dyella]TBR36076.1 hypothetical protein EYV96_15830 [Dyella terrae]TCI06125.1 hypothetical protein EZM97_34920 [Dyella soli]
MTAIGPERATPRRRDAILAVPKAILGVLCLVIAGVLAFWQGVVVVEGSDFVSPALKLALLAATIVMSYASMVTTTWVSAAVTRQAVLVLVLCFAAFGSAVDWLFDRGFGWELLGTGFLISVATLMALRGGHRTAADKRA